MALRLSMMSYTMSRQPRHFSLPGMMALTAELGLDGIDFVTLHDTPAAELRQMADDIGVPVVAHTFHANFSQPDADSRRQALDDAKRGIEAAVVLGAPVLMIPTAGREGQARDQARDRWIAGLAQVAPLAGEAGLTLTVENFPGAWSPFVTAADFLKAQAEVPALKLTWDNGNAQGGEDTVESYRRTAEHVVHVHFKDWSIRDTEAPGYRPMLSGQYFQAALIGEGDIDQPACLAVLKEAGYDGYVNLEYEGNDYPPDEAVRRATAYLREVWAGLE